MKHILLIGPACSGKSRVTEQLFSVTEEQLPYISFRCFSKRGSRTFLDDLHGLIRFSDYDLNTMVIEDVPGKLIEGVMGFFLNKTIWVNPLGRPLKEILTPQVVIHSDCSIDEVKKLQPYIMRRLAIFQCAIDDNNDVNLKLYEHHKFPNKFQL